MARNIDSMSIEELRNEAKQNSANWHTVETNAEKDALHARNVEINRAIDERTGSTSTYDAPSGKWTTTGGSSSGAVTITQTSPAKQMVAEYQSIYAPQNSYYEQAYNDLQSRYNEQQAKYDAQMAQYNEQIARYNEQQSAYQKLLSEQKAAQDAAVQQAVNALESQKSSTDAQYSDLFRQLYINKMKNRKNLDQRLAAGGVTGGAAESTRLGYDTAYEDALRQGEQGRIAAIGSLDQAIADARLTGDIESANAAAEAAKEQMSAYADALRFLINRQDTLDARQEAYAREDAQRAAAYAQQMAALERQNELARQEAEQAAARPTLTVAQVNAAIKAGVLTDAVLAAYEYYYGEAYKG